MTGKKLKKINGASKKALNQAEGYQNSSVIDEMQNMNEESFILHKIQEAIMAEFKKVKQENRKQELDQLMFAALQNKNLVANLTVDDSIDLMNVIQKKLKEIDIKMA
ncbi:hypothetical protein TSUD_15990 [Trifolium subterraneum]|uniref:No apical meristem-associated C-terminal domain-containing protein n=1 Tax=Trifolium subterraneum TaxID=3900 RepID=A0A2Z6MXV3_TRISU|nr:hypothetical protein TSUD_15990 [Trifolium subterraneum]